MLIGIWYEQQKASRAISFLEQKMCLPINFDDIVNLKLLSIPISEDLTNVGVSNC